MLESAPLRRAHERCWARMATKEKENAVHPSATSEPTVRFSTPEARQILVQVMLGEEESSRLIIHDLPMHVDESVLRMGGIGGVQTLPALRKKGYARLMLSAAVQHMDETGFDVSVLFGIHNFYHRYGFITSLIDSRLTMPTRLAEAVGQELALTPSAAAISPARHLRPYQPERDLGPVLELYKAKNSHRTGYLDRQPSTWWGFRLGSTWGRQTEVFVLVEGEGLFEKVVGYLTLDRNDEEVTVSEAEADDERGLDFLIGHLGRLAVERRVGQITFFLHPESDLSRRLRYYGCEITTTYAFDRGSMARVINLERSLRKLLPVLDQRLAASSYGSSSIVSAGVRPAASSDRAIDLQLAIWDANSPRPDLSPNPFVAASDATPCRPQAVHLWNEGPGGPLRLASVATPAVSAVSLPQELFTQLFLGYRPAAEVLAAPSVQATAEQVELLDVLFPPGAPYVPRNDRF